MGLTLRTSPKIWEMTTQYFNWVNFTQLCYLQYILGTLKLGKDCPKEIGSHIGVRHFDPQK